MMIRRNTLDRMMQAYPELKFAAAHDTATQTPAHTNTRCSIA